MVLVVDDDVDILDYIKEIIFIASPSTEVVLKTNPIEALRFLNQNQVNLILSDIMMPEIQGEEFLSKLRSLSQAPVIFISGAFIESFKELASKYNVYFFEKPFVEDEVIQKIRELLA